MAHIQYILAYRLQIDADPDLYPAYHFDAEADPDPAYQFDAVQIRILPFDFMRIHADADPDTNPQHFLKPKRSIERRGILRL